jgi:hypothetical protein
MRLGTWRNVGVGLVAALVCVLAGRGQNQAAVAAWKPEIPKTWDERDLATYDVPLANPAATPRHLSAEYYYKIPVRPIFKSYPVYHPGREPAGYFERLKTVEPETAFDPDKLHTEADWTAAGELVFEAPIAYDALAKVEDVRDSAWYERTGVPVAGDGTVPFFRYVVREKGKVELGQFSCATCHTRVMPDGKVIPGAQGNLPLGRLDGLDQRRRSAQAEHPQDYLDRFRSRSRGTYGAPWLGDEDPQKRIVAMSAEGFAAAHEAIPAGVQARFGTGMTHPVQVPDLIGVRERRYLDRTGHAQNRSIADLMRYAALNQGMAFFDRFGDFQPAPPPADPAVLSRYSDGMLYALGLYIYALKPPENPNKPDALSARGQRVFEREGCDNCHTPPLYTNNKLTPVDGFTPRPDHPQGADILPFSVGTDPGLALYTRRGTGLYKVPSLKGLWYRGPLEHSGSVATLEDWFDPRRLRDDYVPTGFRGAGVQARPVIGHRYVLTPSEADRKALIAFLKTL